MSNRPADDWTPRREQTQHGSLLWLVITVTGLSLIIGAGCEILKSF